MLEPNEIHIDVDGEAPDNQLILRVTRRSRLGWDDAFAEMAAQNADRLLDDSTLTHWEQTEWEWS